MKTVATPRSPCPRCEYEIDQASSVAGERAPTPGDFSVCLQCGAVLRFDDELRVRLASDAEVGRLRPEVRQLLNRVRAAVQSVRVAQRRARS